MSAQSYRVIDQRRSGMQYQPVSGGALGSEISFTSSTGGLFTRNFLQEGGQLWAEIKA